MPRVHALRPLSATLALALTATLALGPATPAEAAKERHARGTVIAPSTLGSTISWSYDVNARGVGYAAWVDGDGSKRRVLVAKRSPKGAWSRPTRLTGTFSWKGKKAWSGYADVAVDKKGRATVVWVEPAAKGVVVRTASSKARGWTRARTISAARDSAGFPDVEVSDKGHAVVLWAGDFPFPPGEKFSLWAAYRGPRGSWSRPSRLDEQTPGYYLDARPNAAAIDDRGVATIVWDEMADDRAGGRIQSASRGPSTGWTQATLATGTNLNAPAVTTTGAGDLVAAWRDFDGLVAVRRDPAGVWSPAQKIVTGSATVSNNLFDAGISAKGRVALLGEEVILTGSKVRPFVVVQDRPGRPWKRIYVDKAYRQYGIPLFLPDLAMSRTGVVTVSWEEQRKSPSQWARTYVRTLTKGDRWKPVTRVGAAISNPAIGVDGKGRFSAVFGEGGCCTSLRYASLR